jgi:flagellar hook-basal body complex protein FliE
MIEQVQLLTLAPKTMLNTQEDKTRVNAIDVTKSFGQMLDEALRSLDAQKQEADLLTKQYVTGQISDVHSVMIAAEKASLALELTVQIRNKVIEAYQEIMRIQV